MTKEEMEDLALLGLANAKGLFALAVGTYDMQPALERIIDRQWITLVDLTVLNVAEANGAVMRIFRLTSHGRRQLLALRKRTI